jgi:Tfp pilus assembly protein PilF
MLGLTSLKKGDKADAAAKMQRVLSVDPTSPEAAQARTVMEQLK